MADAPSCIPASRLQQFVLGQLPIGEIEELAGHVETCPTCARVLSSLPVNDVLVETIAASTGKPEQPAELIDSLLGRLIALASENSTPGEQDTADTQEYLDRLAPPQAPGELGWLGSYRILELLGTGGMGMVFRAEDPALQRQVALKIMRPELARRSSARKRFLREARAAAAVTHDNIVAVYQVGEDNDLPFLAMQLLKGESLHTRLVRGSPVPIPAILQIGREVAAGLVAAHEQGLIHRDIKPGNIWLEEVRSEGPLEKEKAAAFRVKILDFGLVQTTDATESGRIAGTPAYVAPEQVRGEPLDGRCDLFALGCVLYQLCTGRLPFPGADSLATLRSLALEDPPAPRTLNREVPESLSALIVQLLAKRVSDRPRNAGEVVAAITAIARDPTRRPPRARRGVFFAAFFLLAPLSLVCGPDSQPRSEQVPLPRSEQPEPVRRWPIETLRRDQIPLYELTVAGGGNPAKAPEGLVAILGDSRLKHWDGIHSVAFSPDGKILASGSYDHTVKLWDPTTGKELRTLTGHPADVQCVAFDASGHLLASVSSEGTVKLWDADTGKERHTFHTGNTKHVGWLALSPDGTTLVTVSWDGRVKCWEAATGKERWSVGLNVPAGRVAFRPDGQELTHTSDDGHAHVRDTATGTLQTTLKLEKEFPISVTYSSDGRLLAAGWRDGTVGIWDTLGWKKVVSFPGHRGMIHSVAFRKDGKVLATAGEDKTVKLWDTATGTGLRTFTGYPDPGRTVAFRSDTAILAAVGGNVIQILDTTTGEEVITPGGHQSSVNNVAFHPGGRWLATVAPDKTVRIWDVAQASESRTLRGHQGAVDVVAFSPSGDYLATGGRDGKAKLWETATWTSQTVDERYIVVAVAFSPDSRTMAHGTGDGKVKLRDVAEWKERRVLSVEGDNWIVSSLAFSPDGRTLANADAHGPIKIRDPVTGREIHTLAGHNGWTTCVAYRSDGRMLASACTGDKSPPDDGSPRLWDPVTGKELRKLTGHGEWGRGVAFSGTTLVTVSGDGTARLWDSDTGAMLRTFRLAPPGGVVNRVAVSPDGRHFATANGNGTVYVFRLPAP